MINKIKNINIPSLLLCMVKLIKSFLFGWVKKIYEIANQPKYSYFTEYDDHMMEFDENLVVSTKMHSLKV